MIDFALSNIFWHVAFQVHSVLADVGFLCDTHMSVVQGGKLPEY